MPRREEVPGNGFEEGQGEAKEAGGAAHAAHEDAVQDGPGVFGFSQSPSCCREVATLVLAAVVVMDVFLSLLPMAMVPTASFAVFGGKTSSRVEGIGRRKERERGTGRGCSAAPYNPRHR